MNISDILKITSVDINPLELVKKLEAAWFNKEFGHLSLPEIEYVGKGYGYAIKWKVHIERYDFDDYEELLTLQQVKTYEAFETLKKLYK